MKLALQVRSLAITLVSIAFSAIMIANVARAEIIFSSTNFDIEVSVPVNVGSTPLNAVTLTAVGKNGYKPKGFDSTKSDFGGLGTGITTTGNLLHQVGLKIGEPPFFTINLFTPTNESNLAPTLDTHFLIDSGTYLSTYGPSENMNVINTTDHAYGHYGDSLVGTFSLNSLPTSSTWNFAYLVVPNNTSVHFDFEILGALDSQTSASANVVCSYTVPEPNCLILICSCGIGMFIYTLRRRKV
jgi:hypothetical protein